MMTLTIIKQHPDDKNYKKLIEFLMTNNIEFHSHPVFPQYRVSGSLPVDGELEDWLFDGYERNEKNLERLKIGRVVRDRIAQKLNSGNDR